MKTNSISNKRILVTLSRPYRIVLIIAFISSVTGMVIDLAGYLKNQYDFLSALNIISLLIYFVALAGFLTRKIDLRRSAIIFIYTMVINILASNIFSSFNNLPDWPFNFLRGTLVIAVFIAISGLILHKGFLIGINLLYASTAAVIWKISAYNFVSSNILFFILLLAAFSYAMVLFMERLRISLLENRQLQQKLYLRDKEVLEKDNELAKERALRLQETLELRNRELMSHALLLTQQVENQTRIYDKLYKLLSRLDPETEKELLEVLSDLSVSHKSRNWEEFQRRFESVHQDFYRNLLLAYPNLSPAELKLAAFIKLGLSNKEISSLTSNTVSSVEVARSRLRKKLEMKSSDNLASFLAAF